MDDDPRRALRRRDHRHRGRRWHPRASTGDERQTRALAGARTVPAAGAGQLGLRGGVRARQVPRARVSGTTATATSSSRRSTTTSAGTPSSTAPRCSGSAPRTSGRSPTTAASPPPGRSTTRTSSPTTPRPSSSTRCTGDTVRTSPRVPFSRQYAHEPVAHEPRIQQLSDDLEKVGLHPFHLPIGVDLHEDAPGARRSAESLHPVQQGRRVPVPARRQERRPGDLRRAGARPRQRHARHRGQRAPTGDRSDGTLGHPDRHRARGRRGGVVLRRRRRGRLWCRELGRPAPEVRVRHPPGRAGQPVRGGGASLHAAQQRRPDGGVQGAEPDELPEDARRSTTGTPGRTTGTTPWVASRCSASPTT